MLKIKSKTTEVTISTNFGAILNYATAGFNWLRPTSRKYKFATDCACFPLVPFCNRIANGRFEFNGHQYKVPQQNTEPNALHGQGWLSEWLVISCNQTSCHLSHSCNDKNLYPFAYRAEQIFSLNESSLKVMINITSLEETMPAGIGLHPYFEKSNNLSIKAKVAKMWQTDKNKIPTKLEKNFLCDELHSGKFQPQQNQLDNSFSNWDGKAKITWEEKTLSIEADSVFQFLACYSPDDNFFCIEPTSNAPDAFNLAAKGNTQVGMQTLAKNETLSGTVIFNPIK